MTAPAASSGTTTTPEHDVLRRLGVLDRFLPIWIGAAIAARLLLGRLIPGLNDVLDAVKIGNVSLPIAIGLLAMMYPVLAKVRYDRIGDVTRDHRLLVPSLILNWLVGPPSCLPSPGCSCRTCPTTAPGWSSWAWPAVSPWS